MRSEALTGVPQIISDPCQNALCSILEKIKKSRRWATTFRNIIGRGILTVTLRETLRSRRFGSTNRWLQLSEVHADVGADRDSASTLNQLRLEAHPSLNNQRCGFRFTQSMPFSRNITIV